MSLVRNFARKKVSRQHLAGTIEQYHEGHVVPNFVRYDRYIRLLLIAATAEGLIVLALGLLIATGHVG